MPTLKYNKTKLGNLLGNTVLHSKKKCNSCTKPGDPGDPFTRGSRGPLCAVARQDFPNFVSLYDLVVMPVRLLTIEPNDYNLQITKLLKNHYKYDNNSKMIA